jgi:hypothetical protein
MLDSVADGLDKYQDMAKQVPNSQRRQDGLSEILLDLVFAGFAKRRGDGAYLQHTHSQSCSGRSQNLPGCYCCLLFSTIAHCARNQSFEKIVEKRKTTYFDATKINLENLYYSAHIHIFA